MEEKKQIVRLIKKAEQQKRRLSQERLFFQFRVIETFVDVLNISEADLPPELFVGVPEDVVEAMFQRENYYPDDGNDEKDEGGGEDEEENKDEDKNGGEDEEENKDEDKDGDEDEEDEDWMTFPQTPLPPKNVTSHDHGKEHIPEEENQSAVETSTEGDENSRSTASEQKEDGTGGSFDGTSSSSTTTVRGKGIPSSTDNPTVTGGSTPLESVVETTVTASKEKGEKTTAKETRPEIVESEEESTYAGGSSTYQPKSGTSWKVTENYNSFKEENKASTENQNYVSVKTTLGTTDASVTEDEDEVASSTLDSIDLITASTEDSKMTVKPEAQSTSNKTEQSTPTTTTWAEIDLITTESAEYHETTDQTGFTTSVPIAPSGSSINDQTKQTTAPKPMKYSTMEGTETFTERRETQSASQETDHITTQPMERDTAWSKEPFFPGNTEGTTWKGSGLTTKGTIGESSTGNKNSSSLATNKDDIGGGITTLETNTYKTTGETADLEEATVKATKVVTTKVIGVTEIQEAATNARQEMEAKTSKPISSQYTLENNDMTSVKTERGTSSSTELPSAANSLERTRRVTDTPFAPTDGENLATHKPRATGAKDESDTYSTGTDFSKVAHGENIPSTTWALNQNSGQEEPFSSTVSAEYMSEANSTFIGDQTADQMTTTSQRTSNPSSTTDGNNKAIVTEYEEKSLRPREGMETTGTTERTSPSKPTSTSIATTVMHYLDVTVKTFAPKNGSSMTTKYRLSTRPEEVDCDLTDESDGGDPEERSICASLLFNNALQIASHESLRGQFSQV